MKNLLKNYKELSQASDDLGFGKKLSKSVKSPAKVKKIVKRAKFNKNDY